MKTLRLIIGIALATFLCLYGTVAHAQACGERTEMVQNLETEYKETLRIIAPVDEHRIVEIFVSPNGSWTAFTTFSDGTACISAAGEDFQYFEAKHGV